MPLTDLPTRTEAAFQLHHVGWPANGITAGPGWVDYLPLADELLVYFDRPLDSVSIPIDTPDRDYVYLLIDDATETVVGVQVDALQAWVAAFHPRWAPLADPAATADARTDAAAALIADAAGLFARYGAGGAEARD